jgi:hypothetical protein
MKVRAVKRKLTLVFIALFAVSFFLHRKHTAGNSVGAARRRHAAVSKKLLKETAEAPVQFPTPPTIEKSATGNACVEDVTSFSMSTEKFAELVMDGRYQMANDCGQNEAGVNRLARSIQEKCVRQAALTEAKKRECLTDIAYYRAFLIEALTSQENDLSRLSEPVLLNKAIASFWDQGWKDPVRGRELSRKVDAIADELLRRRPEWEFAYKLKLSTRDIEHDYAGMAALAEKAYAVHPDDGEVLEATFASRSYSNEILTAKVGAYLRDFPQDDVGYYWKAWALNREGKTEAAGAALHTAIALDPGNERYRNTLATLTSGGKDPFYYQFRLPFEDL